MRIEMKVEVELERQEGLFASRDELVERVREALESADDGSFEGDNGGIYESITWDVSESAGPEIPPKPHASFVREVMRRYTGRPPLEKLVAEAREEAEG